MVTAIILVNAERDSINSVAEALVNFDEISEVYSVGGRYDLVAISRVEKNEDLAELVTSHIATIQGIRNTETMIAFKTYSRHDLERMFSIGMEE